MNYKTYFLQFIVLLTASSNIVAQGAPLWIQSANNWAAQSAQNEESSQGGSSFAVATSNNQNFFATLNTTGSSTPPYPQSLSLRIFTSDPQLGTNALPIITVPLEQFSNFFDVQYTKVSAGGSIIAFTYGVKNNATSSWWAKAFTYDLATQTLTTILNKDTGLHSGNYFSGSKYSIFANQTGSRVVLTEQLFGVNGKKIYLKETSQNSISEWILPFSYFTYEGKYKLSRSGNALLYLGDASSSFPIVIDLNTLIATNNVTTSMKLLPTLPGNTKFDLSTNALVLTFIYSHYVPGTSSWLPALAVYKASGSSYILMYTKIFNLAPLETGNGTMVRVSPDGRTIAIASKRGLSQNDHQGQLSILHTRSGEVFYQRNFNSQMQFTDMAYNSGGRLAYGIINASLDSTLPTLFGLQISANSVTELFSIIPYPTVPKNVLSLELSPSGSHYGIGYGSYSGSISTSPGGYAMGSMQ